MKAFLTDLQVTEETNYPNTITSENEKHEPHFLVKTHNTTNNHLLELELQVLHNQNKEGKDIIVDIRIKDLMVYYFQQPVLRILDFLLLDLLPSLEKQSAPKSLEASEGDDKMLIPPRPPTISINIEILDSYVHIKPTPASKDSLKIHLSKVTVKNSSVWSPDYGVESTLL